MFTGRDSDKTDTGNLIEKKINLFSLLYIIIIIIIIKLTDKENVYDRNRVKKFSASANHNRFLSENFVKKFNIRLNDLPISDYSTPVIFDSHNREI